VPVGHKHLAGVLVDVGSRRLEAEAGFNFVHGIERRTSRDEKRAALLCALHEYPYCI
jgi:hypothetical protein